MTVRSLVLDGNGLNCAKETNHALELAGADSDIIHVNKLVQEKEMLEDYHILVLPGGFSRGDHHGAGVIEALNLEKNVKEELIDFVDKGNLIIGICNGFQILSKMGMLPNLDDYSTEKASLTANDCGNFQDRWVKVRVEDSPCVFTNNLDSNTIRMPIRHGEGKFFSEKEVINDLFENDHVVLRYSKPDGSLANREFPYNPNGSLKDIAGICDKTGRIFGLMPHPEASSYFTHQPDWTRKKEELKREDRELPEKGPGRQIFESAISYVENNLI